MTFDVIIVGAGAAGLMCAAEAGRRGRRVLLVDHAERAGKKILISGGGRSNFTNLHCRPENFLSENAHFAKSALARFTPADMVALVERHGIAYHEKTLGQLFCDGSARELVTALERDCSAAGVRVLLETAVSEVAREGDGFRLVSSAGVLRAGSLVVATGGLSIPKMGATGWGYGVARQCGLRVTPLRAGLVPFTFGNRERELWCDLAGVSAEVVATSDGRGKPVFREKLLLTHKGVSGPAVLQISSYWPAGGEVVMDLAPGREVFAGMLAAGARRDAAAGLAAVKTVLPGRWAERWMEVFAPDVREFSNAAIAQMEAALHGWRLQPGGTEGYPKAEVTGGGVDTAELDARTLQAKRVPGLYFIGEVVDVTGWLGGFNFQWAWASAVAAGAVI